MQSPSFQSQKKKLATGTKVIDVSAKQLAVVRVPVPPLEVQREIVRILDSFSELEAQLEAELEAELEARRVQYSYYRDSLMTFKESSVRRVPLGDVGVIFGGLTGKTKADFSHGNARFVSYVNIFNNIAVDTSREDFVRVDSTERQRSLKRGDVLFTGSSETAAEVGVSSVVTEELVEPLYLNSFSIGFRPGDPTVLEPDFTKHLFRSDVMRKQVVRTASGVTRFNVSKARLAEVEVPIPPLGDQRRIASILDKFESLTANLSAGLPAELRARRLQYEYYRDRLLPFKELPDE